MNYANLCINCMREKPGGSPVCPHCGYDDRTYTFPPYILPPLTPLNGKYIIGRMLGAGGFGITYIALDTALDRVVAIKEFFIQGNMYRYSTMASEVSVSVSTREERDICEINREKFEQEAKTLARLSNMPGIVRVFDFFQENNTSYMTLEYLPGQTLEKYVIQKGGKLSYREVITKLVPVMTSLDQLHNTTLESTTGANVSSSKREIGIIHRDISPDNIMVSPNGVLTLFDFGGAKIQHTRNSSMVLAKKGYTPYEQIYSAGQVGPWSDVYAMAATIYYCLCGHPPMESAARGAGGAKDPLVKPSAQGVSITPGQERVLLKGLAMQPKDRYQTMHEFRDALKSSLGTAAGSSVSSIAHETKQKKNPMKVVVPAAAAGILLVGVLLVVSMQGTKETLRNGTPTASLTQTEISGRGSQSGNDTEPLILEEETKEADTSVQETVRDEVSASAAEETGAKETEEKAAAEETKTPQENPADGASAQSTKEREQESARAISAEEEKSFALPLESNDSKEQESIQSEQAASMEEEQEVKAESGQKSGSENGQLEESAGGGEEELLNAAPTETEAQEETTEPAEFSTEKETEPRTETETEPPTEKETEAPAETETEPHTETETEPPTEKETEAPTETETEQPTEKETEAPTETETEPPTEKETELVTETETEQPTEAETESITETETEQPTERETELVTETETEPLTETETEPPTEKETEPPTEKETEPPTEKETEPATSGAEEILASFNMGRLSYGEAHAQMVDSASSEEELSRLEALKVSKDAYQEGKIANQNEKAAEALSAYAQVIEEDVNFEDAQDQIERIRESEWVACQTDVNTFLAESQYPEAISRLDAAQEVLPDSEELKQLRQQCVDGYSEYVLAIAEQRESERDYETAKQVVSAALALTGDVRLQEKMDYYAGIRTLTVNGGSGSGVYLPGETVTLQAGYPPDGMEFAGWNVNTENVSLADAGGFSTTMTMPEEDVTVEAFYQDGPSPDEDLIQGISQEYEIGEEITFEATGSGMDNTAPNPGDYRYRPGGYSLEDYFFDEWVEEPFYGSVFMDTEGEFLLEVYYEKEIFDGETWVRDGSYDWKSVTITVVRPSEEGIHDYDIVYTDSDWEGAFDSALLRGGYLAHINSQEEFDYLVSEVERLDMRKTRFYLGARRDLDGTSYYWTDESNSLYGDPINGEPWWLKGEPSMKDLDGTVESIVEMYYNTTEEDWVINDVASNLPEVLKGLNQYSETSIAYICEYDTKTEAVASLDANEDTDEHSV